MKKFSLLLLIIISLLLFISCNKNNNEETKEKPEEVKINHSVEFHKCQIKDDSAGSIPSPSYYSGYTRTIRKGFDNFNDFDDFILNKLQEEYMFIFPLFYNDSLFEEKSITYEYKMDIETYNALKIDNKSDDEILEECNYNIKTGLGKIYINLRHPLYGNTNEEYPDGIDISMTFDIGKSYNDYLIEEGNKIGKKFDVKDIDNYFYREIRHQYYISDIYSIYFYGNNIEIYSNDVNGFTIMIRMTPGNGVDDTVKKYREEVNIAGMRRAIDETQEHLDEVYDKLYNLIMDYGFKVYTKNDIQE